MDRQSFPNVPFTSDAAASAHPGGADHQGQANYTGIPQPHPSAMFERNPYPLSQQYPTVLYDNQSNFSGHDAMMSSMGNHSNLYPESSQRTHLHETLPASAGFGDFSNSGFDAPHLGSQNSISSDFTQYGSGRISSMGDRPPARTMSLGYTPNPAFLHQSDLPRRRSDGQFQMSSTQIHPIVYSQALSQPMTYPTNTRTSSTPNSGAPSGLPSDDVAHMFSSLARVSRSPDTTSPSAISYQHLISGTEMLSANPHHHQNIAIPHSIPSSIPMRKASSEWLTPTDSLSVQGHVQDSSEGYTPTVVATDIDPSKPFLHGPLSNMSQEDSKLCLDQAARRTASPSVPSVRRGSSSKSSSPYPSDQPNPEAPPAKKKKKSKMHACEICEKKFPRPSGLRTHMNTHNNARPYPCGFPGCTRTFGVRSNAKRHLRTHGVTPTSSGEANDELAYVVGFSTPVIVPPSNPLMGIQAGEHLSGDGTQLPRHQMAKAPFYKLRWMPPSLTSRTNAASLNSVSENGEFSDDEDEEEEVDSQPALAFSHARGSSTKTGNNSCPPPLSTSSSSSSLSGTPSGCSCPFPCTLNTCMSYIATGLAQALPHSSSSSIRGGSYSLPKSRAVAYDEAGPYNSSQYWGMVGQIGASMPTPLAV